MPVCNKTQGACLNFFCILSHSIGPFIKIARDKKWVRVLLHASCGTVEHAPSHSYSPYHVLCAGIRRLCHARTHCWVTYLMPTVECWSVQPNFVCMIGNSDAPQGGSPAGGRHPHPQYQDVWGWQAGNCLQQFCARTCVRMCDCVPLSACICVLSSRYSVTSCTDSLTTWILWPTVLVHAWRAVCSSYQRKMIFHNAWLYMCSTWTLNLDPQVEGLNREV